MNKLLQNKNSILLSCAVVADVFIKIIVDHFLLEYRLLINDNVGFIPYLNTDQLSIFNNELELDMDLIYLIFINIIGIVAIVFIRNKLKKEKEWNKILDLTTLIILAGTVCSLIDKIFWKGSLDYLLFFSKIIDLKDIYLFVGIFVFIVDLCRQSIKEFLQKNLIVARASNRKRNKR